ncbi:uncharacterized protein LOC108336796 [Vigna angularis]|uniref:uncharacterized protein LOC108336796 n=1 Tax=Phaseolus angularis TaxID=3914 RepID=UPI000809EAB8|nr:uncharacterized protein LOC108336796 [Vigna angularis]
MRRQLWYKEGNCNIILQKEPPPNVKDPGSFTIPCTIGNVDIGRALIVLGSSINLMPLSVLEKIGGLEVKPTKMTLQMADRSTKKPYGVVEDVMVRIDKLKFLVDFVVMEMEQDVKIPIILGRLCMKMAKVIINVDDGTTMLKDQEKEVMFSVFNAEQQIQVKKTNPKAVVEDAPVTSSKVAKPVKEVKFKNKLWVVKELKAHGVIEIEAPY